MQAHTSSDLGGIQFFSNCPFLFVILNLSCMHAFVPVNLLSVYFSDYLHNSVGKAKSALAINCTFVLKMACDIPYLLSPNPCILCHMISYYMIMVNVPKNTTIGRAWIYTVTKQGQCLQTALSKVAHALGFLVSRSQHKRLYFSKSFFILCLSGITQETKWNMHFK